MKTLRLILGDQLNSNHSWFRAPDPDVIYTLMELRQETDYAEHHQQKVIAFFLAMRHFADALRAAGHRVDYRTLDDPRNTQSLTQNLTQLLTEYGIDRFEYLLPDEYRLDQQLAEFCASIPHPTGVQDTEHFYTTRDELARHYGAKKFIMEFFYRKLRQRHNVLMQPPGTPLTGQWNYDEANRQPLPKNLTIVPPKLFVRDVTELVQLLERQGVKTMGRLDPTHFIWPVTRAEFLEVLAFFNADCLARFGTYQDAMHPTEWSLFHARLSFGLNTKLISPREVINSAIAAWQADPERISYAQIEGFVRQILGWREYMRGVYWAKMPGFAGLNTFNHTAALPGWYWTGETRMNCLHVALSHSLDYAYAHHIHRLMITGNFALLLGVHPDAVDAWYLGVYIDAIEWVEITNVRGMSQFADGGVIGTKPYVSSASYINRMSPYCKSCFYKKDVKVGERACPFNSLYWDFYDRHRSRLESNPRVKMMYRLWDKMSPGEQSALLEQADRVKQQVESL
ncbi:cryptochrome/photolyase family protein [Spirosoma rhododendri]|uniref:Cryptochrome/photolyase family protein n=1 Tax=Spirosoma rhododendri TaxID=2728024 RepID=A0A7L5DTX7_9BACT|nr:cryptochrome/photolyase family protein [Spirosoma rhododendri]QJD79427.1 cryptochrome/photolyase family protein [Spirosoma rhododendri]